MTKIRSKIFTSVIIVSLFGILLTGIVNLYYSWKITRIEALSNLQHLSKSVALTIEKDFDQIENESKLLQVVVENSYANFKCSEKESFSAYKNNLNNIIKNLCNELRPLTLWVIFHPDVDTGKNTVSYQDIDTNGVYEREPEYRVSDFNLKENNMTWWVESMTKGEIWTLPYYWANWNAELITYSRRANFNGKPIAAVGSDFEFSQLRQKLSKYRVYKSGFLVLMDSSLNIIIHPLGSNNILNHIFSPENRSHYFETFKASKNGLLEYNDEKQIISYARLHNGWIVAVFAPYNEVFSNSIKARNITIAIIIIVIVIAWIIATIKGKSITKPITNLVGLMKQGSSGDLTVRAKLNTNDETKELATYFNELMQNLQMTLDSLKYSENNLQSALAKAEESEMLKTIFINNISHEIRTPLNHIVGFSNLLSQENVDEKTKKEFQRIIERANENLLKLINGLIDFSKAELKRLQLKETGFNLNELMDKLFQNYYDKKLQIELIAEKSDNDSLALFTGDYYRINQVMKILLDNAYKFTKEGCITYGYHKELDRIIFFVKDTGVGISAKQSAIIFQAFRQGDENSKTKYGGTGLGLTLAKQIVELMKGEIWYESKENQGSTFSFSVPLL